MAKRVGKLPAGSTDVPVEEEYRARRRAALERKRRSKERTKTAKKSKKSWRR